MNPFAGCERVKKVWVAMRWAISVPSRVVAMRNAGYGGGGSHRHVVLAASGRRHPNIVRTDRSAGSAVALLLAA